MKTIANSLRVGNIIEHEKQLWKVLKFQHTQPGKGGAYIQVEMKNVKTGNKSNIRFASSESISLAFTEQKVLMFQYFDGSDLAAMDMESYESFTFPKNLVGESLPFLQEGMNITVEICNEEAILIRLPEMVTARIEQADAVVKGQTATSSYKPAILENGFRIMVPPFVESGEEVVVNTEDFSYVGRAK